MSNIKLNPYLNFNGNTKEAMEFYHQIFGGELTMQTYGEAGMPAPDEYKDNIMHADLTADHVVIMASEGQPGRETVFGENINMSLNCGLDQRDRMTQIFNALAEGGEVSMPLEDQPWNAIFGSLTDKFGIHWMVNIDKA